MTNPRKWNKFSLWTSRKGAKLTSSYTVWSEVTNCAFVSRARTCILWTSRKDKLCIREQSSNMHTVDKLQRSEIDVIIYSTVWSNKNGDIGHYLCVFAHLPSPPYHSQIPFLRTFLITDQRFFCLTLMLFAASLTFGFFLSPPLPPPSAFHYISRWFVFI